MKDYDTARPYSAAYVIFEKDGKYLFVRRAHTAWMNGHYGLPAGKVEKYEGFRKAAVREAKEEVGLEVDPKDLEFMLAFWRQEEDEPDMEWVDVVFRARTWKGEPYNAEPHMHDEIAWLDKNNLPDTVVPSLAVMLQHIAEGKSYGELKQVAK